MGQRLRQARRQVRQLSRHRHMLGAALCCSCSVLLLSMYNKPQA